MLAWLDIAQRYRRSMIGPMWLVLSTGIWIASMGLVFATLFKMNVAEIYPYIAAGMIVWVMLSQLLNDACITYLTSKHITDSISIPMSVPVYRIVWRNIIIFGHNIIIYVLVAIYFSVPVNWNTLLVIPGLALLILNGLWVALLLGMAGARFRDLQQIVANIVQIVFFVTPIFWPRSMLGHRPYLADVNVLYHFLEVVRAPLLGQAPAHLSWVVVGVATVLGWFAAFSIFSGNRGRIQFWL